MHTFEDFFNMPTYHGELNSQNFAEQYPPFPSYPPPSQQLERVQQAYAPSSYAPPRPHKSTSSNDKLVGNAVVFDRIVSRTPSPTPSEVEFLNKKGMVDWKAMMSLSYWKRKDRILRLVIVTIVIVAAVLIGHYDKTIVHALEPVSSRLKTIPAGWLVPIALLVVLSFPPLFGHEIVDMLCGVIWGFGIGFGIVCAGTLLGEIANFYAFRWCCKARGDKYEKTNLRYACLAKVVREGGFRIALISRYSAIPGHLLTAVYSTVGIHITIFALAATLSLPKQAALVFIGTILEKEGNGQESKSEKAASGILVAVTILVTIIAMRYINREINAIKEDVVYARRKSRQIKAGPEISIDSSFMPGERIPGVNRGQGSRLHEPSPSRGFDNNSFSMSSFNEG